MLILKYQHFFIDDFLMNLNVFYLCLWKNSKMYENKKWTIVKLDVICSTEWSTDVDFGEYSIIFLIFRFSLDKSHWTL